MNVMKERTKMRKGRRTICFIISLILMLSFGFGSNVMAYETKAETKSGLTSAELEKFYQYNPVTILSTGEEIYMLELSDDFETQLNKDSGGTFTVGSYTWKTGNPLPDPTQSTGYHNGKRVVINSAFQDCKSIKILDLSEWNTSHITDMKDMFQHCSSLESLNISNWDTSNVTNMSGMFQFCSSLRSMDFSGWNMSNVERINYMFTNCTALTEINIKGWDTSSVTSMDSTFKDCESLTNIEGIEDIDVSNLYDLEFIFIGCSSLRSLDLSKWDVPGRGVMYGLFKDCSSLTNLDLSDWKITAKNTGEMFSGCSSLRKLDISGFDISKLYYSVDMFKDAGAITSNNDPAEGIAVDKETAKKFNDSNETNIDINRLIFRYSCSVKYNANGGNNATDNSISQYMSGDRPMVAINSFKAPEYMKFGKWNTKSDGSGDSYMPGENIAALTDDVTLYAIWSKIPYMLIPKVISKGQHSQVLTWSKIPTADGYYVYAAKCDSKKQVEKFKKIKTISDNGNLKYVRKKLKEKTAYKYFVAAYKTKKGKNVIIKKSMSVHSVTANETKNNKNTNAKSLKLSKETVYLSAGKAVKIKGKLSAVQKNKKIISHTQRIRFLSDDSEIATVSKGGTITGKNKGECYVYALATNGVRDRVKVIVK